MPKQLSQHAAAAKMIRQALKKQGIACSVTSDSFSMGNSVDVHIKQDVMPATRDAINRFCDQFQYGHFNGMEDIYEYSNSRDDIPQAKYVSVSIDYSDHIRAEARAYAAERMPENLPSYELDSYTWRALNGSWGDFWRDRKPRQRVQAVAAKHVVIRPLTDEMSQNERIEIAQKQGVATPRTTDDIKALAHLIVYLIGSEYAVRDSGLKSWGDDRHFDTLDEARAFADAQREAEKPEPEPVNWQAVTVEDAPACLEGCELAIFPALNKNSSLRVNDEEIVRRAYVANVKIERVTVVDGERFAHMAGHLFDQCVEWEGVGGNSIDDEHLEGLQPGTDAYYAAWKTYGVTHVAKIENAETGEFFYADTQGYVYARYAGRPYLHAAPAAPAAGADRGPGRVVDASARFELEQKINAVRKLAKEIAGVSLSRDQALYIVRKVDAEG